MLATSAKTVVTPRASANAKEDEKPSIKMPAAATVDDLVKALNELKASPRDLIAVLQALKSVGSLDADLEVL